MTAMATGVSEACWPTKAGNERGQKLGSPGRTGGGGSVNVSKRNGPTSPRSLQRKRQPSRVLFAMPDVRSRTS